MQVGVVPVGFETPLTYQGEPLSARIIPYFLRALAITRACGLSLETSNDAFRRTRSPIGGRAAQLPEPAWWRAG